MAADAACRGIRAHDQEGPIGLIGAEPDPPYSRPPLSKGLWQGRDEASIWRVTEALGVDLHLGRRVLEVGPSPADAGRRRGRKIGGTSDCCSPPAAGPGGSPAAPATR